MVAATVTTRLEVNNPIKEVVVLTATDEYTYTSKKFGRVIAGQATFNSDQASLSLPISLAISGAVVTLNCTGMLADKVCLTLYGTK